MVAGSGAHTAPMLIGYSRFPRRGVLGCSACLVAIRPASRASLRNAPCCHGRDPNRRQSSRRTALERRRHLLLAFERETVALPFDPDIPPALPRLEPLTPCCPRASRLRAPTLPLLPFGGRRGIARHRSAQGCLDGSSHRRYRTESCRVPRGAQILAVVRPTSAWDAWRRRTACKKNPMSRSL